MWSFIPDEACREIGVELGTISSGLQTLVFLKISFSTGGGCIPILRFYLFSLVDRLFFPLFICLLSCFLSSIADVLCKQCKTMHLVLLHQYIAKKIFLHLQCASTCLSRSKGGGKLTQVYGLNEYLKYSANKGLGLNFSMTGSFYSKLTIKMRKNPALVCELKGNDGNDTSII